MLNVARYLVWAAEAHPTHLQPHRQTSVHTHMDMHTDPFLLKQGQSSAQLEKKQQLFFPEPSRPLSRCENIHPKWRNINSYFQRETKKWEMYKSSEDEAISGQCRLKDLLNTYDVPRTCCCSSQQWLPIIAHDAFWKLSLYFQPKHLRLWFPWASWHVMSVSPSLWGGRGG